MRRPPDRMHADAPGFGRHRAVVVHLVVVHLVVVHLVVVDVVVVHLVVVHLVVVHPGKRTGHML
jgi:hypothetical protein